MYIRNVDQQNENLLQILEIIEFPAQADTQKIFVKETEESNHKAVTMKTFQDCCQPASPEDTSLNPHGEGGPKGDAPTLGPPDAKSQPTHWKRPRCGERLKAGGEEGERG